MANTNENDQELFAQTPLLFLRPSTLKVLGDFLNTQKILPSSKGFSRDWRGLTSAADLNFEEINRLQNDPNPTKQIILKWCEKNKSGTTRKISVQDFFDCIKNNLDGSDLYDDFSVRESIKSDCLLAKERFRNVNIESIEPIDIFGYYDVMVLHGDEGEDQLFAEDLIERLEAVGLKVFVKERDLVAGTVRLAESCNIIQQRCRRVIAIFSSSFFESNENEFLTNYAQYIGIQQGVSGRISPIILKPEKKCNIPQQFQMYSKLPYNPHSKMVNFWYRLIVKTLEVQGPLPKELTEYKNYGIGNNQIQTERYRRMRDLNIVASQRCRLNRKRISSGSKDEISDKILDLAIEDPIPKSISGVNTYSDIDKVSRKLLEMTNPSLLEVVTPKKTIEDGNCLFRAASIAASAMPAELYLQFYDNTHATLRQRVFREMKENPKWYNKDDPNFCSPFANDPGIILEKYSYYIENTPILNEWCDINHILALSAVLNTPIESYYPPIQGIVSPYSRVLKGRGVREPDDPDPKFKIMWTTTELPQSIKDFRPNHFVPLIPISH